MSLRVLIQKLAEATGHDPLLDLAKRVDAVYWMLQGIVDEEKSLRAFTYDWKQAEATIREAQAHSKHAAPILPWLKKIVDDLDDLKHQAGEIAKEAARVRVEVDSSDLDSGDLERGDDFGHTWQEDPERAAREIEREHSDADEDFKSMASAFAHLTDPTYQDNFEELPVVTSADLAKLDRRERQEMMRYLSGEPEQVASYGDDWLKTVKQLKRKAAAALAVCEKLQKDLPEV